MKPYLLRIFLTGAAISMLTTAADAVPTSPTGLRVFDETSTSISIAWDRHPNTCWYAGQTNCVIGYCAYYHTDIFVSKQNYLSQQCGAGTSQTFYVLTPGQIYYFVATAFDETGAESWESFRVAGMPGPPAAPTGLKDIEAKNGHVSLSWNANTEEDLLGYSVLYGEEPVFPSNSQSSYSNSATVYGLTNGVRYKFGVKAYDKFGNVSEYSNFISTVPLSYGGIPQWPVSSGDDTAYNRVNGTFGEIHGNHFHKGIDIDVAGTPSVRAALDGIVEEKVYALDNINSYIIIKHKSDSDDGQFSRQTKYIHINPLTTLTAGQYVKQGDILGQVRSDAGHLHFEMHLIEGVIDYAMNPLRNDISGWNMWNTSGYPTDTENSVIKNVFLQPRPNTTSSIVFNSPTNAITLLTDNQYEIDFNNYNSNTDRIYVSGEILPIINTIDRRINAPDESQGAGLTVYKTLYQIDGEYQFVVEFDRLSKDDTYKTNQIFHQIAPLETEEYGNNDFIELRSLDDIYLYPHKLIYGQRRNGILNTRNFVDGDHTLTFYSDDASGRYDTETVRVNIDNYTPPRFAYDSETPSPLRATNDATPTIGVNFFDPFGIDEGSAHMIISGPEGFLLNLTASQLSVTQSGVSFTPTQPLAGGVNGIYEVFVDIADQQGNMGTWNWFFVLDTTPPTIQIELTSPLNGNMNYTPNPTNATVVFGDNLSGVSEIRLSNDASNFIPFIAGISPMTIPWNLPAPDGSKTLYALAIDDAGNLSAVDSDTIILDTIPPPVSTETAVSGGIKPLGLGETEPGPGTITFFTAQNLFTFTWDPSVFSDINGIADYSVKVKNITTSSIHQQGTTSVPSFTATGLADTHRYYAIVYARDPAGNASDGIGTPKAVVDQTPPVVTTVDDGIITNDSTHLTCLWSAEDLISGIIGYTIAIGSIPGGQGIISPTSIGVQTSTTVVFATPLSEGKYYWTIRATNQAGLTAQVTSDGIIVDTTPPASPINSLADGSNPSPWKNIKEFNLLWTNPEDLSGISGARVKFDGTPPVSNDEGEFYSVLYSSQDAINIVIYSTSAIVNGSNIIWLWLEDRAGNANPATTVMVILKYDDIAPGSTGSAPTLSSSSVIPVSFSAIDEGAPDTGSGIDKTILWHKHESDINWSSSTYVLTGSNGAFSFNALIDGNWYFYIQAIDIAGNFESVPVSTTIAKAQVFVDTTPPIILNIKTTVLTPDSAKIEWTTDDETTGIVEIPLNPPLSKAETGGFTKVHSITLTNLPNPADVYFKITAENRTGLKTESSIQIFKTPVDIKYETDFFGVIDYTKPVTISVTNPEISYATITVNGFTWTGDISTSTPLQVYIDTSTTLGGTKNINVDINGYTYDSQFIVDTATRTVRLARLVIDEGGVMTEPQAGQSAVDMTAGQPLQGEMSSGQSRLYLGYYAGIDPVAPGQINDLSSQTGSDKGEVILSWIAVGDDANVGTAMKYDLRYSTEPINFGNFNSANLILNPPYSPFIKGGYLNPLLPEKASALQNSTVSGLNNGTTYYFALKVYDELMNSSLSNSATTQTLQVAQSTTLINGQPAVEIISKTPDISIVEVSTTDFNPMVALATASAEAQGLIFFSGLYDIGKVGLVESATIYFRYEEQGLEIEQNLAIYKFSPADGKWTQLISRVDTENNIIKAIAYNFSYFAVFIKDIIPPVTKVKYENGRQYINLLGNVFITSSTLISFAPYDPKIGTRNGSGISRTEYKLNTVIKPFEQYILPIQLEDGQHYLQYRSIDKAGNIEQAKALIINTDSSGPEINYSFSGTTKTLTETTIAVLEIRTTIYLEIKEPFAWSSGFKEAVFKLDGSTWSIASIYEKELETGKHHIKIKAWDNLENETEKALQVIVGDVQPPRSELIVKREAESVKSPDGIEYVTSQTSWTLTSIDDLLIEGDGQGLGVKKQGIRIKGYGLEGIEKIFENPEPKQGEIFLSTFTFASIYISTCSFSDGIYYLDYNAEDILGNIEKIKTSTIAVDNTPPITEWQVEGVRFEASGKIYINENSKIILVSTDPVINDVAVGVSSTIFKIDEGDFNEYVSSFSLTEGKHKIIFYSIDKLGNKEQEKTIDIYVDATPPVTSLIPSGEYYIPKSGPHIEDYYAPLWFTYKLNAYDPLVKDVSSGLLIIEYRIIELENFNTEPLNPSPQDLGKPFILFNHNVPDNSFALTEGIQRVDYRSKDNVLNQELTKTTTIWVDATAPVSAIIFLSTPASRSDGLIISSKHALTISSNDPIIKGVASGVGASYFLENNTKILTYALYPTPTITPYYVPATIPDGYVDIKGYSIDNVGNNEVPFTRRVVLDNTSPFAYIISPSTSIYNQGLCKLISGTQIKIIGSITDVGTHADGTNFDHFQEYTLEYGWGAEPSSYQVIITSVPEISLIEQVLGTWNTTGLPEGIYTLRLRAKDCVGNEAITSIQAIISGPKLILSLGQKGNGPGEFNGSSYIAINARNNGSAGSPQGDFWISDTNNDRVQKFNSSGTYLTEISTWETESKGKKTEKFNKPTGLAVDAEGNLWAADRNNDRVLKFSSTGTYISSLEANFNKPHGLATDKSGNIYVADRNNNEIKKFSPAGELLLTINTGLEIDFNKPQGAIAVDELNQVYITDRNNDRVLIYDSSGNFIRQLGGGQSPFGDSPLFNKPDGIFTNALAYVYVADSNNSRIQKFDPYGNAILVFNKGINEAENLNHPSGVAIDSEGNLFVVDSNNAVVKKYGAEGELIVIASQGEKSVVADLGPQIKKLVKKSEGGSVYHPKGIKANVPQDSLTADTEITITSDRPSPQAKGVKRLTTAGFEQRELKIINKPVEFGPEGTIFSQPVEISLPYDPAKLNGAAEDDIRICWYNSTTNQWEEMQTTVDKVLKLAKTWTNHFSIYVVMAPEMPPEDFKLGEVYVFPNPAKGQEKPRFHIETGIADKVTIKIYTLSGRFAHEHFLTGMPQAIDDGNGRDYAYEYTWNENIPSGVYYYSIESEKSGKKLKNKGKFAVIR